MTSTVCLVFHQTDCVLALTAPVGKTSEYHLLCCYHYLSVQPPAWETICLSCKPHQTACVTYTPADRPADGLRDGQFWKNAHIKEIVLSHKHTTPTSHQTASVTVFPSVVIRLPFTRLLLSITHPWNMSATNSICVYAGCNGGNKGLMIDGLMDGWWWMHE